MRHYLSSPEMVKGYRFYERTGDIKQVASLVKCSYSNARSFLREIQQVLAGGNPERSHGRKNIMDAVYTLQRLPENFTETPIKAESTEEKMNRLFEEFKSTVSDWAYEQVEQKNKELVEAAKKSNIADFLRRGLTR